MICIIYIDDYKVVHYRVVVNIKSILTCTLIYKILTCTLIYKKPEQSYARHAPISHLIWRRNYYYAGARSTGGVERDEIPYP